MINNFYIVINVFPKKELRMIRIIVLVVFLVMTQLIKCKNLYGNTKTRTELVTYKNEKKELPNSKKDKCYHCESEPCIFLSFSCAIQN